MASTTQADPASDRATASSRVYEALHRQITRGELSPGQSLPGERKLSSVFGVNRGAVREGLKRLEQSGLVSIHHGGATRVRDYSASPTLDLMVDLAYLPDGRLDMKVLRSYCELHLRVTPHIVRLAAERGGPRTEGRLRGMLERIDREADPLEKYAAVLDWWRTLAHASENIAYSFMWNSLSGLAERTTAQDAQLYFAMSGAGGERFAPIVDAVLDGDADRAERCTSQYLIYAHGNTLERLEAYDADQTRFNRSASPPDVDPVAHAGVSNRVFAKIRDGIVSGVLTAGSLLPGERVLAQLTGANRGAVREALKRLEQAGLIAIQHGGGTRVLDLRRSCAMDVLSEILYSGDSRVRTEITSSMNELRARVAPDIARLAARRGGDRLEIELRRLLSRLESGKEPMQTRLRLWEILAWASDNLCYSFVTRLAHHTLSSLRKPHLERAVSLGNWQDLRPLIEALLARDEDRAFELADGVARSVERSLSGVLRDVPPAPPDPV